MALIQARVKLTNGDGKIYVKDSPVLNVSKAESALDKEDLMSDKLIFITGIPSDKFFFVAGDKLRIRKYNDPESLYFNPEVVYTSPGVLSNVINITKTGWYAYDEFAPAGMRTVDYSKKLVGFGYYIEPTEYNGDRYYGGMSVGLMRISSIKFCSRFIHCGSLLAPAGIYDKWSNVAMWGEVDNQGVAALKIPAHLEDMSGLFDMANTIDKTLSNWDVPKIITLGKPKKMHRTFTNAFNYGMFTYEVPAGKTVFGEMDVSMVTDFSYCFGNCYQVNPDIENWDVSSATNMTGMFQILVDWTTDKWTRNLSNWCVSKITSEPVNFSQNHPMSAAQKPVWGTCPVIVSPAYSAGYYNAISGGTKVTQSGSSQTKYLRFKLDKIPAGTVLTLKAGRHGTPASNYYTDFTVLKANGAIDSSNGVKTRMYGDGSPDREITLTFPNAVINPTEFVIAVNIWNVIYTKDKYGTNCTNYVYQGTKAVVAEYISLTWGTNY